MNQFKRPLAWLLSLSMVASYIPTSYAQETELPGDNQSNYTQIQTETLGETLVVEGIEQEGEIATSALTYEQFRKQFFATADNDGKQNPLATPNYQAEFSAYALEEYATASIDDSMEMIPNENPSDTGAGFQQGEQSVVADISETATYGFGEGETTETSIFYDSKNTMKLGTAQLVAQGEHSNIWVMKDKNPTDVPTDTTNLDSSVDGAIQATNDDLLAMTAYVDNIYKKMTQGIPHAEVVVDMGDTYGNVSQVGDVDMDGRVNVILYDFGSTSVAGYFSTACYFTYVDKLTDNTVMDAVHMDFDGFGNLQDNFYGTFAHELQHLMYHTYLGVFLPNDMDTTWINESLSGVPDMYYADESAYNPNTANTNTQNLSVSRMASGTINSYVDSDYGDFVNFNGSLKNYGMSYMFSAMMTELEANYFNRMYQQFRSNVDGKTYGEAVTLYQDKSMEAIFGEAFQTVLKNRIPSVMNLSAEDTFEYVYTAFMESYISGGGDVVLSNGTTITTSEITKAPFATLWSSRNGNVAISSFTQSGNSYSYGYATPNENYSTLASGGTITMSGYGTGIGNATHELLSILDTTNYTESANYLKIKVGDENSSGFLAYVALYDNTNALATYNSDTKKAVFNSSADISQDHADIYPLTLGEDTYIKVESTDVVPHLVTVSYFGDVSSSVTYEWVVAPTNLEQTELTVEDSQVYTTGDGLDLSDLISGGSGTGAVTYALGASFETETGILIVDDSVLTPAECLTIDENGILTVTDPEAHGKTFTVTATKAGDDLHQAGQSATATITIAADEEAPVITLSERYAHGDTIYLEAGEIANWKAITATAYDNADGYMGSLEPVYAHEGTVVADLSAVRDHLATASGNTATITFTATDSTENANDASVTLISYGISSVEASVLDDCPCGVAHGVVGDWTELTAALVDDYEGKLPEGNYFLDGDVKLNAYNIFLSGTDTNNRITVNLCLNGNTLTATAVTGNYNAVLNMQYTDFTLYDGEANDGVITGGSGYDQKGGGIYATSSSLTLKGGNIADNGKNMVKECASGGGVYARLSTVELDGTNITGNQVVASGAGIYLEASTMTIKSGTIDGNKCSSDPKTQGIYVAYNTTLTLSGEIDITDPIYLTSSAKVTIGDDFSLADADEPIAIAMYSPGIFTTGAQDGDVDKFVSFEEDYDIFKYSTTSNELKLVEIFTVTFVDELSWGSGVTQVRKTGSDAKVSQEDWIFPDEKDGYTFQGWFTDGVDSHSMSYSDAHYDDVTLYAQWSQPFINLLYPDTSLQSSTLRLKKERNSLLLAGEELPTPVREGYDFLGWYNTVALGDEITYETTHNSGDQIFAQWQKSQHNVHFINGTTTVHTASVEHGQRVTAYAMSETATHTFGGWYYDNGTFENSVNFNAYIEGEMFYYAKWELKYYDLTFKFNGSDEDKVVDVVVYVPYDDPYFKTTLEGASDAEILKGRDGYTFMGWSTDENADGYDDSTVYWNPESKITDDMDLYAIWKINTYTVEFRNVDGVEVLETVEVLYNNTVSPNTYTDLPEKDGYDLVWLNEEGLTRNFPIHITKDSVFTARYDVITYTVTFDYGFDYDENGSSLEVSVVYDTTVAEPTEPPRTGYTFLGWTTDRELTSDTFDTETDAWDFADLIKRDTSLYAVWEADKFTVTFKNNGAEGDTTADVVLSDVPYDTTYENLMEDEGVPTPSNGDFSFLGWYTEEECTNELDIDKGVVTEDLTLWAKWSEPYTITVKYPDSDVELSTKDSGKLGDVMPDDLADEKYRLFKGWYTGVLNVKEVDGDYQFTGDTIIYPLWNTLYAITLAVNEGGTLSTYELITDVEGYLDADEVAALDATADTGYRFIGWFVTEVKDDVEVEVEADFTVKFVENTTITAHFYPYYIITLTSGDNGTVTTESLETNEEGKITQDMLNEVEKSAGEGYKFKGWYTDLEGNTALDLDTEYDDNAEIFALWIEENGDVVYTITIESDSAKGSVTPETLETETDGRLSVASLNSVTATAVAGYEFDGFFLEEEGKTEVTIDIVFQDDTKIFAIWKEVEGGNKDEVFTITIDSDSSEGTVTPETLKTETNGKLSDETLESVTTTPEEGYEFDGFFLEEEGKTEVTSETVFDDDTTIFALWKDTSEGGENSEGDNKDEVFTITIESDSSEGSITPETLKTETNGKLSDETLESVTTTAEEGYEFDGFFLEEEGKTEVTSETVFDDDTTIFALWKDTSEGGENSEGGTEDGENAEGEDDENAEGEDDENAEGEDDENAEGEDDENDEGEDDENAEGEDDENAEGEDDENAEGEDDTEDDGVPEDYTLLGKVTDSTGEALEGVTITVKRNGTTYETVESNEFGNYYLEKSYSGYYYLVFDDGTMTKTVSVNFSSDSTTLATIAMPSHKISTESSISTRTMVQTVAGLDTLADLMSLSEKSAVTVSIEILASTPSETQELIENVLGRDNEAGAFFEVSMYKRSYSEGEVIKEEEITETENLLQLVLDIPTQYQGKANYYIYRLHNNDLDIITTSTNSQNERIVLSEDGKTLTVYTRNFSTYAFVYEKDDITSTGPSTGLTYPIIIERLADGEVSSSATVGTVGFSNSNPAAGALVTVTPYPGSGYQVESVTVSTEDGSGLSLIDRGDGSYTFTQGSSIVTVTVAFISSDSIPTLYSSFSDVSVTDYYCDAINQVVEMGLMTGTTAHTFSPNNSLTRGMLVTILYKLSGNNSYGSGQFMDVYTTDYYYNAVAWAKELGIVSGYVDGTFRPGQNVTREELAVIFDSYCEKMNLASYVWLFPSQFVDNNVIGAWASNSVAFCTNLGIMDSKEDYFYPSLHATRGEVAVSLLALSQFK